MLCNWRFFWGEMNPEMGWTVLKSLAPHFAHSSSLFPFPFPFMHTPRLSSQRHGGVIAGTKDSRVSRRLGRRVSVLLTADGTFVREAGAWRPPDLFGQGHCDYSASELFAPVQYSVLRRRNGRTTHRQAPIAPRWRHSRRL